MCVCARACVGAGASARVCVLTHTRRHALLLELLLLKEVVVGFPSLSFSWFSVSIFNDLERERKSEARERKSEVEGQ